jgi:tetratricopeptide (TPR) repeat protein
MPMIVVSLCLANFCNAATTNFFECGLAAADAGNFSGAADDFEKSACQNPSYGALLNLGICKWQRGHAGAAVLAWERAQWLDPLDSRAAQNLKFAREVSQLDVPELHWHERVSAWLPADWWVWISGASSWLAVGALVLPRFLRWKKSAAQQFLAAFGCGIFLFSLVGNLGELSRANIGFVLKKNASLFLTPTHGGEVISTVNAGESGRVVKVRGNYFLIRTELGLGWVERGQFGLINPR